MSAAADRNLLFGILALQNNFVSREALLAAFTVWVADKSQEIGQLLLGQKRIDSEQFAILNGLVSQLLKQHGGSPEKCLHALSSVPSARDDLNQLRDSDLQASLQHVERRW